MSASGRKTVPLTITLSHDQLKMVKTLVASGGYASDSEVIREGLRLLQAREQAMERWINDEVVPAYIELKKDPSSGMSVKQLRVALSRRREKAPVERRTAAGSKRKA